MRRWGRQAISLALALAMGLTSAVTGSTFTVNAAKQADSKNGFVTTNGTKFQLNGSDFYYGGTNCYYLNFKPAKDADTVLESAADMGISVVRTWGHLDVGTKTGKTDGNGYQVFENNVDGPGQKDGVYYQYFDADLGRPVVNEGKDGLGKLDYVLYKAQKENIKVLITFTNNWTAFGGMEQYVKWAGLNQKDDFYTNAKIKQWFKDYIKTMLNHVNPYTGVAYKDDPTIFAWELANEPRCDRADPDCSKQIVYKWASEMSKYIKSMDPNHMVAVGDEGFFNFDDVSHLPEGGDYSAWWVWRGMSGMDYEKLMTIPEIDFGTPHIYLQDWNFKDKTTINTWLNVHAEIAHENNKPVILEEFGWKEQDGQSSVFKTRNAYFENVFNILEGKENPDNEYAGSNYWMIADYMTETGAVYPDYDGYTVWACKGQSTESTRQMIIEHCTYMNNKGDKNGVNPETFEVDIKNVKEKSVAVTLQSGAALGELTIDGKTLQKGTDYSVNGTSVTFRTSFLSKLDEGEHCVVFKVSKGNAPELIIHVKDSSITSAVALEDTFVFDRNPKVAKDIIVPVQVNDGGDLKGVNLSKGAVKTALDKGNDFEYAGGKVTIKLDYLKTIIDNKAIFELDFTKGTDPLVTVNYIDTTGADLIEDFNGYSDNHSLSSAWVRNGNGDSISSSLVEINGSKAMKLDYALGGNNYAGVQKSLGQLNLSEFDGVEFWYQPDGSKNTLTIQMHDAEDVYWEAQRELSTKDAESIRISFSEFAPKDGYGQPSGSIGDVLFHDFAIYVGTSQNTECTSGTLLFDNIAAYSGEGPEIISVESVSLDQTEITLNKGESVQLKATVLPENATNKNVIWSSDNSDAADVKDGKVTANSEGTATIQVMTKDGNKQALCRVTVNKGDIDTDYIVIDDFASGLNRWNAEAGYDYSAGKDNPQYNDGKPSDWAGVSHDSNRKALKMDLNYSKNSGSSWSEAKISKWFDYPYLDTSQASELSYTVTYPKEFMDFAIKVYASIEGRTVIDTVASLEDIKDNGDGTLTGTVRTALNQSGENIQFLCLGIAGKYTNFIGTVYIDDIRLTKAN